MESLQTILLVLQVLVSISLICLILIQHGKGADAGAAFGSGSSSTVFGSQGSSNFLSKTTAVLALIFLANSLTLAYISTRRINTIASIMDQVVPEVQQTQQDERPSIEDIQSVSDSEIPAIPE